MKRYVALVLLLVAYLGAVGLKFFHAREAADPQKVTIRIAHWQLEKGVREGMDAVIRRYEELNPHVRVEQMLIPDNLYRQWLQAQLVGGTAPDIIEYGFWYGRAAELQARYFEPLDRWLGQPNPYNTDTELEDMAWRETFLDGLDNLDCYNPQMNQFFGVTLCTGSTRIFYNRQLLKEITGADNPPRDFREFLVLCAQIREYAAARGQKLVPLAGSRDSVSRMSNAMIDSTTLKVAYGLDYLHRLRLDHVEAALAYLRGEWRYDQPEFMAGLELSRAYCLELDPSASQEARDSATRKFANGDAVMFGTGSFDASSLKAICPFEVGAFKIPVPTQDDPEYGHLIPGAVSDGKVNTGFSFYLLRQNPNQAQALDFMRFMTSQPGVQIFGDESHWLPGIVGAKPTEFSREYAPDPNGYSTGASFWLLSGPEAFGFFMQSVHDLISHAGSAGKFAATMDAGLGGRIITDIRRVTKELVQNHNQQDVALAARRHLEEATGAGAYDIGFESSSSTLAEARAYRFLHTLWEAEGRTP